jgi:hypothetical protein
MADKGISGHALPPDRPEGLIEAPSISRGVKSEVLQKRLSQCGWVWRIQGEVLHTSQQVDASVRWSNQVGVAFVGASESDGLPLKEWTLAQWTTVGLTD